MCPCNIALEAQFKPIHPWAIRSYTLRLCRNASFAICFCVFCVRLSARKTHKNIYYNLGSPTATRLYGSPYSIHRLTAEYISPKKRLGTVANS